MKREEAPEPWQAWLVAITIIVGFGVGGIGVIVGWPMFWVGVGVIVFGVLLGWRVRIMQFTEEYTLASDRVRTESTTGHG